MRSRHALYMTINQRLQSILDALALITETVRKTYKITELI